MQRALPFILVLVILLAGLWWDAGAQSSTPQPGDPPIVERIRISPPDETGLITITGEPNAVFPAAQLAIRNLYSGETVYVTASITGAFNTRISGTPNTPFWISPATMISGNSRNIPGSLPGGPGTIIYSPFSDLQTSEVPATTLQIDGELVDWDAYEDTSVGAGAYGLVNRDALYLAFNGVFPSDTNLGFALTFGNTTYDLVFDPLAPYQLDIVTGVVNRQVIATIPVIASQFGETLEMQIAATDLPASLENAQLDRVAFRSSEDATIVDEMLINLSLPFIDEVVGFNQVINLRDDVTTFYLSGAPGVWSAEGRIDRLDALPGDTTTVQLDVSLNTNVLPEMLVGEVIWQPLTAAGLYTNNGWSNLQTRTGLAINNVRGDVRTEKIELIPSQLGRRDGQLLAGFTFETTVPENMPPGRYVPAFTGMASIDGVTLPWNVAFALDNSEIIASTLPITRLPIVLNIGDLAEVHLPWALFYDQPSDGVRGILALEDMHQFALSNRVKFNGPSYILPPGDYAIEPYILNQMANLYDISGSPLIPFLFPSGRLSASVTRPDGSVDNLPNAPIRQSVLGAAPDESVRFGGQSPVDVYQLSTLDPEYTAYAFDMYGEYVIELAGSIEDIYGNVYSGGGTYTLVIAEPIELLPGVLPGTPFDTGDALFSGGKVLPGLPADVTITVNLFSLNGDSSEETITMTADRYGFFNSGDEVYRFDTPGEYVIDYEVRFEDDEGRLWASSLRSVGVIADPDSALVAHGQRGIEAYLPASDGYRPAWFTTAIYPPNAQVPPRLYYPYNSGDVAFVRDGIQSGINLSLTAQDRQSAYADWLRGTIPAYQSPQGLDINALSALQELPLRLVLGGPRTMYQPALLPDLIVNQSYAYFSAVKPGVSVRQLVLGNDASGLPLYWDGDDPYNEQIGAGTDGDAVGDYVFLFGGGVVRNAEAGINTTAGYAAIAIIGDEDTVPGVYPPYRGVDGGADAGPLLILDNAISDMFFHPTGVGPGQVLPLGGDLVIAGQVAPTLLSEITVNVTAPDGEVRQFTGLSNAFGYFYDPEQTITVNQPGIWTVEIVATGLGPSSAGQVEPPLLSGGVPGAIDTRFSVYVVPGNAEGLSWNQGTEDVTTDFRPGSLFNFNLQIPPNLNNPQAFYIINTPAYLLEQGTPRIGGSTVTYQLNPNALRSAFPNLELNAQAQGASASDVLNITFVILGEDDGGNTLIRSRTFTIFHDRLLTFEDARQ